MKKYAIYDRLMRMNIHDYRTVVNNMPLVLNMSKRTFERYLYASVEDNAQISADKLAIIAVFLNCRMDELINYEVPQITLSDLKTVVKGKVTKDFKLKK